MTKPAGRIGDSTVAASSVTTASRGRPPIEGFIDHLTRNGASGWAWMPSSPQTTIEIEAVQGGKVIGRARAERPRPDLLRYNKGTGLYGFSLTFDHSLEGDEVPQIRASGLGEAAVLGGVSELPPNAKPATQRAATAADSRACRQPDAMGSHRLGLVPEGAPARGPRRGCGRRTCDRSHTGGGAAVGSCQIRQGYRAVWL
jgi:hypothetical protein